MNSPRVTNGLWSFIPFDQGVPEWAPPEAVAAFVTEGVDQYLIVAFLDYEQFLILAEKIQGYAWALRQIRERAN